MNYCPNCGHQVDPRAVVCPFCGVPLSDQLRPIDAPQDTGSVGWAFLGFLIPPLGLILFLVWFKTQPKNARAVGIGAIIPIGLIFLLFGIGFFYGMVSGILS